MLSLIEDILRYFEDEEPNDEYKMN